jgi:ABC-type multidrug transport system ATPase subunit
MLIVDYNNTLKTLNSTDDFKKSTSYITQDDRLQLLLTVFENMKLAAELKLGSSVSRNEKNERVS